MNYKHAFDDIDDETIENFYPQAVESVNETIKSGKLGNNALKKFPYMYDGKTMLMASDSLNNPKATNLAHEVMYVENNKADTTEFKDNSKNVLISEKALLSTRENQDFSSPETFKFNYNDTFSNYALSQSNNKNNNSSHNYEYKGTSNYSPKSLLYNNESYNIYVPGSENDLKSDGWETVDEFEFESDLNFDVLNAFTNFELDDVNGILDATNNPTNKLTKQQISNAAGVSLVNGILNAIPSGINKYFISFLFQRKDDQKRTIIKVGSLDTLNFHNKNATGNAISIYDQTSQNESLAHANMFSENQKKYYKKITGKQPGWNDTYDIQFTLDPQRRGSPYYYYISVSDNGKYTMSPMVYPKDKYKLGVKVLNNSKGFKSLINLSPYNISFATNEYKELINDTLNNLGIVLK